MLGIMDLAVALQAAREKELDLVEVAPTAIPLLQRSSIWVNMSIQQETAKKQKKQT